MTFDATEASIQSATPVELYDFITPVQTWRMTSYGVDVTFSGNTYTATTKSRSSLTCVDLAADQNDLTIELPATHAIVQAYAPGVPIRELRVKLTRLHIASGVSLQMWDGYVAGLEFKGRMASFRVPSGTADTLSHDVPGVYVQRLCNNILYDTQCTKLRTSFQVVTTISAISSDGRTITTAGSVPSVAFGASPWARHGDLLHSSSTERRTITDQPGGALNQFSLQYAFPNGVPHVGDAVTIYAGCDLLVSTCRDKFANVLNFTGAPNLAGANPFYVGLNRRP